MRCVSWRNAPRWLSQPASIPHAAAAKATGFPTRVSHPGIKIVPSGPRSRGGPALTPSTRAALDVSQPRPARPGRRSARDRAAARASPLPNGHRAAPCRVLGRLPAAADRRDVELCERDAGALESVLIGRPPRRRWAQAPGGSGPGVDPSDALRSSSESRPPLAWCSLASRSAATRRAARSSSLSTGVSRASTSGRENPTIPNQAGSAPTCGGSNEVT